MSNITIDYVNQSTLATHDEVAAYVAVQQIQCDRDFSPAWGVTATCQLVDTPTLGNPTMFLLDNPTIPGAFGYHDITKAGVPVGFCFLVISQEEDEPWQVTASHETLELLGDPWVGGGWESTLGQDLSQRPVWMALEVCDPVESDTYDINGVIVSNFILPTWFQRALRPKATKWDYLGNLTGAHKVTPGGFFAYQRTIGNWREVFGKEHKAHSRRHVTQLSRLVRRFGVNRATRLWQRPIA